MSKASRPYRKTMYRPIPADKHKPKAKMLLDRPGWWYDMVAAKRKHREKVWGL